METRFVRLGRGGTESRWRRMHQEQLGLWKAAKVGRACRDGGCRWDAEGREEGKEG